MHFGGFQRTKKIPENKKGGKKKHIFLPANGSSVSSATVQWILGAD